MLETWLTPLLTYLGIGLIPFLLILILIIILIKS